MICMHNLRWFWQPNIFWQREHKAVVLVVNNLIVRPIVHSVRLQKYFSHRRLQFSHFSLVWIPSDPRVLRRQMWRRWEQTSRHYHKICRNEDPPALQNGHFRSGTVWTMRAADIPWRLSSFWHFLKLRSCTNKGKSILSLNFEEFIESWGPHLIELCENFHRNGRRKFTVRNHFV